MSTRPNHKPTIRVAQHRSWCIDEVDGVPTTHTQRGWVHAWNVADDSASVAPFPVAAKGIPAVAAVPAMLAVVLTATVAALVTVTAGHPDRARIVVACLGALGGFCLLVAIPAVVRSAVRISRVRTNR